MVGERQVTRKDVAELAGVSVATVSYVVNDGPRPVAAETRARVEAAIKELGYYPNELARSLSTKTTAVIGLITPTLTNPFYAEVAQSLENVCSTEGYLVLWSSTGRDLARELELPKILRAKQVDGVVMIPSEAPTRAIAPLLQARIPTVVLEHCLDGVHCIAVNELQGGLVATQHLLALGHRRIGMLKHEPSSQLSYLRVDGYCQALEEAGVSLDPALVVVSKAGQAGGFEAMQKLLALPHPPTAVFAHNDTMAWGAMHAIHASELRTPDDISVVGYDDAAGSLYLTPPLTTVRFPVAEMGRRAGQIILNVIREGASCPPESITLPVELVVRKSTAPPAT